MRIKVRQKNEKIITYSLYKPIAFALFFIFLLANYAHAANVALVVKDAASLSAEHEKDVKNALLELGHTITYVDKNSAVDYNAFDLIVIAGRPKDSTESLDSFVASIPVNTRPSVAVDGKFPANWGWASGVSSIHSTGAQTVYIFDPSHAIASGLSGTVAVHTTAGKSLSSVNANPLSFVATPSSLSSKGIVAYANSKKQLLNGQKTKNRVVFFGITSPLYWTADAEKLFKQSVAWALNDADGDGVDNDKDLCPNTPPELDADANGCTNSPPVIAIISPVEGATLDEGSITTITVNASDPDGASLSYTVKVDGNVVGNTIPFEYTWSYSSDGPHVITVVASDGVHSAEANVNVNVIAVNLIPGVKSFVPESATVEEGDTLQITVEVLDDDLLDIRLYKDSTLVKSILGYKLIYDWKVGFNEAGTRTFMFNATDGNVSLTGSRTYTVNNIVEVSRDVDGDGVDEFAANKDKNDGNGYELYHDPNGNSAAIAVNGDDDGKTDFVINGTKYWDPDNNIFTSIMSEDVDNDGSNENVFDTNNDEAGDRIFVDNSLIKYPDLTAEISFSNNAPNSGETVQISANIKNVGGFGANDFVAELYVDGALKDNKTLSIGAGASKTMSINYTATKTHEVKVKVDTTNKIKELSESNEITRSLSLYSPPSSGTGSSGGSGGGSSIIRSALCTILDSEVVIDEGSAYALNLNVKNTGDIFLSNVRLNVNGFPSAWLSISPASDVILVGRTTTFSMVFDARTDGTYSVSIDALSDSLLLCKRSFTLRVRNIEQQPQPIVEPKKYPAFEITDLQVTQKENTLLLAVKLKNSGGDGPATIGVNVPEGWVVPDAQVVDVKGNEEMTLTFTFNAPENAAGANTVTAYVSYDSSAGTETKSREQMLVIEQSSPLTGLVAGTGSALIFVAVGSAAFLLLALHKYIGARRSPWHSSIAKYSWHEGRLNPLILLLLAVPAYFVHPMVGFTVAGAVLAMYAAVRLKTSKFRFRTKIKKIYDFKKSRR